MKTALRQVASPESILPSNNGWEQDSERQKKKRRALFLELLEAVFKLIVVKIDADDIGRGDRDDRLGPQKDIIGSSRSPLPTNTRGTAIFFRKNKNP